MICKFIVGQKVVCINDNWRKTGCINVHPVKGEVFIIREIYADPLQPYKIGLRFKEIKNIINTVSNIEYGYDHNHFVALQPQTKETSIECFTKMLNRIDELI